jgi:ATP-dependent helicase/nuclease subunit B
VVTAPHLFTIPAGAPFVDALAAGILRKHGGNPLALSRVTVLLPTRRACRSLREAFLRGGDGAAMLLPTIRPLGDVAEDELDVMAVGEGAAPLDLPPAMPDLQRLLLLARLVMARPDATPDPAMAVDLAGELADLLDSAHTEGLGLDALERLVPEDFARHWQITLKFLDVLRKAWPAILAEQGAVDAASRRIALLDARLAAWRRTPPADPVYAAGSTGSIPATANLLGLVARLPQGAVVLPGFEPDIDETLRAAMAADPTHPQHGMVQLLERIGAQPAEVQVWPDGAQVARRDSLLRPALLPATATATWPALPRPNAAALAGLRLVVAPTPREEALAIAVLMREVLETPGRTAALVTPDRTLARRVAAELARWDVAVDDSAGTPLAQTVPGAFFRLALRMAAERAAPLPLLAALKHPLARGDDTRADFLKRARRLDRKIRGLRPAPGFDGVIARVVENKAPDLVPWLETLREKMSPLADALADALAAPSIALRDLVAHSIAFAEWLAGGAAQLYAGEAGEALAAFGDEILEAAPSFGTLAGDDWPALLDRLMAGRVVRPRYGAHPRLAIWGLLEARLQQADLVILGGLNEGVWPPEADSDPWLSRPMRRDFGLPAPERRLGQTAHDFVQAASAAEVVLTRAEKVEGTPTVPARWLLRLEAFLHGDPRWDDAARADASLSHALALDRPAGYAPVQPPEPRPPVSARPRLLYVTDVKKWVRDPYAIFARRILNLKPLDPLDAEPDHLERGSAVHEAIEAFYKAWPGALPDDAEAQLVECGRAAFADVLALPVPRTFWWPRFLRAAAWLMQWERARRAAGSRPAGVEITGAHVLTGLPGGDFELRAKADRIDRLADNRLAILDYKTGQPPSAKQMLAGLAPQLTLEAAIASRGGFPGIAPAEIAGLTYLRLSGGDPAGEEIERDLKRDKQAVTPQDAANEALQRFVEWVRNFDDAATPYRSRPRPQFVNYDGDYDHLARVLEWSSAIGEAR